MNTRNLTPPVDTGPAGTATLAPLADVTITTGDDGGTVITLPEYLAARTGTFDPLDLIDNMLDSGRDSICERLVSLRAQRDECNTQIRVLVAQLAQLDRLAKARQPRQRRKGK